MRILITFLVSLGRNALHLLTGTGPCCRFVPTCSRYATEALEIHGWCRGSLLLTRRIFRCLPGGGHGLDPVPPKKCPTQLSFQGGVCGR